MPLSVWLLIAFVYGIAIGSFLNVVIWRLPRGGSVAQPTWSYCPRCEHRLGALDLVPVFSFLLLRARCRYCKNPISWRYPGIELLTGVLFALAAGRVQLSGGEWWDALLWCAFTAVLVCVFFVDLGHFIIPDGLNVLGILIGLAHGAASSALGRPLLASSFAGLFGYAGTIYLVGTVAYVVYRDKGRTAGQAARDYVRENAQDWAWVSLYYAGTIVRPLRRFAEPPPPLEGVTADEIEGDADAGGMGGGDGKLAAAIGANLGLALALESFFFAVFIGAFAGLIVMVRQRRSLGQKTAIPFGPAMAAGAFLAFLFGQSLLTWYSGLLHPGR